jgi:hypothetical protein
MFTAASRTDRATTDNTENLGPELERFGLETSRSPVRERNPWLKLPNQRYDSFSSTCN